MRSFLAGLLVLAALCCRARADDSPTTDDATLADRAADGQLSLALDEPLLTFHYSTDTPDPKNWIGIYDLGGGPVNQNFTGKSSLLWQYAPDASGKVQIVPTADKMKVGNFYVAYYLAKDQYSWLAGPVQFQLPDKVQSSSSSSASSTTPPTSPTSSASGPVQTTPSASQTSGAAPPANTTAAASKGTNKTALGVGLGVGLGIGLIGVFGLVLFALRQRKNKRVEKGVAEMDSGGDMYGEFRPGSSYQSSVGLSPQTPYQPMPIQHVQPGPPVQQYPPPTHAPSYQQTPTEYKGRATGDPTELPAGNVPLELPVPQKWR
ncbi:uncharacterized protein E0L32_009973 [Thyridium curvatum]|uniref:Uncharacterized protein n=1 Tax=Thyridium curvatum TaxID=1093900 RepID=A0A507AQ65_9PEZI|nr:uncharacterized protein E0L32_009973 [Thyridium curvatum]TPX08634.1 hypothetical protein E0L32_009973 [Thyridium curvatum]